MSNLNEYVLIVCNAYKCYIYNLHSEVYANIVHCMKAAYEAVEKQDATAWCEPMVNWLLK